MTQEKGQIGFYDNYVPSLEAGQYRISVVSGIDIDTGDYYKDPIQQEFEVRAPQFSLPLSEVHAVYPPADSNARYGRMLPHIVLNKRSMPWERGLQNQERTLPWFCLLALREDEVALDDDGMDIVNTSTVAQFLQPTQGVLKPQLDTTPEPDVLAESCQSIRIRSDVFKAVVPRLSELPYLTHVREVDTDNQAVDDFFEHQWFSVAVGSRMLWAGDEQGDGMRYFFHLVSLEGLADYLEPGATLPEDEIELVSLYSWTCLSQPEKGKSFSELVENFVIQSKDPETGDYDAQKLLLRLYPDTSAGDGVEPEVLDRLAQGYVALDYQLPTGEQSFAWYRGPLCAAPPQALPRPGENYHYPSSDAAMVYDPEFGVFDQSYASAWTLGRLLALSNGPFSQALFRNRQVTYQVLGQLSDKLAGLPQSVRQNLTEAMQAKDPVQLFRNSVKTGLSEKIDGAFSKPLTQTDAATIEDPYDQADLIAFLRQLLKEPSTYQFLKQSVPEQDEKLFNDWLAKRHLLYDIPFNHLVPDEALLPVESLRFFYFDPNWVDMLVDGAISVAIHSSKDQAYTQLARPNLIQSIRERASIYRKSLLRGDKSLTGSAKQRPVAGIIVRSEVVAGWPGLVVKGETNGQDIALLRMDRLSDTVLLCLFEQVPETISLTEPDQGLIFGVLDGFNIGLRKLENPVGRLTDDDGDDIGFFPAEGSFETFYRTGENNLAEIGGSVLNINDGTSSVIATMQSEYTEITPSGFALQMVKAPQRLSFDLPKTRENNNG